MLKYNIIGLQYILEKHSNMYDALVSCATYLVLLGYDYSNSFLDEYSKKKSEEERAQYIEMMDVISGIKQRSADLYDAFEAKLSDAFTKYYA